jgi:hypothetical protein
MQVDNNRDKQKWGERLMCQGDPSTTMLVTSAAAVTSQCTDGNVVAVCANFRSQKGSLQMSIEGDTGVERWSNLMAEAGVSRVWCRLHVVVWLLLVVIVIVAAVLTAVGFVFNSLLSPGLILLTAAVAGLIVVALWRRFLVRAVRWQEGTVKIRKVEPGDVGENGQRVVCVVEAVPPLDTTRVATTVGPLDAERLMLGGTMRCLIDRADTISITVMKVYPYASAQATLPAGREVKFCRA